MPLVSLFFKGCKDKPAGFTAGITETVNIDAHETFNGEGVDLHHPETGGDVPDVLEGDHSELTPPTGGDTDPTEGGHDDVT